MIGDATLVDDRSLLEHYARTHDREAFAELTRRYAGMVYGTCLRVTGNPADAEDVSQECFLELARRAASINSSVPGWLHKVAKTRSINVIRRDSARRNREQRAFAEEPADSASYWAEIAPYVDEAVERLPDNLRLPTVLHYFHGLEQTLIASELRVSQSTVSRQLDKAVVHLRKELQNAGVVAVLAGLALLLSEHAATAAPSSLMAALGRMALPSGKAASSAVGIAAAKHVFATLPGKLAVGALVVVIAASIGYRYKVVRADTPGAVVLPAAPAPRSAAPVRLASAVVTEPAAEVSVKPMETYRGDPFLPANYRKPATDYSKVNGSIPDLPIPRIRVKVVTDDFGHRLNPPPVQPARRMAGLVLNPSVSAILETNGQTEVVQPGDILKDHLAVVESIERDRVVLKTVGNNPEFVTVGLGPAPDIRKPSTPAPAPGLAPAPGSAAPAAATSVRPRRASGGVPMMGTRAAPMRRPAMAGGGWTP